MQLRPPPGRHGVRATPKGSALRSKGASRYRSGYGDDARLMNRSLHGQVSGGEIRERLPPVFSIFAHAG